MSSFKRGRFGSGLAGAGMMVAVCVLAGCGGRDAKPASRVIARVGDHPITEADFRWEVERRRQAGLPEAGPDGVLNELIRHEALLQRARSAGVENDFQVRREVSNLLIGKFLDRELGPRLEQVSVSPEEIKSEYESRKGTYTRPAQFRLAVLRLGVEAAASEARKQEVRQRMEEARQKVLADPPRGRGVSSMGFGRLAVDYSDDQASRYRGGDIGWLEAGRLPARWPRNVLETGLALPVGQYSGMIESTGGVYLVTKTDSRDAVVTPLAEAEPVIRQHLLANKRKILEAAFREEATRGVPASIDTNVLASLIMSSRGAAESPRQGPPLSPVASGKEVQP